ncbi:hypothetical protein [Phreatobacter oligotrophus]|uniref:Uncharacterized protein n=1 Tax=Phreatobacter oligotrophus TaxID=1122261 RepID=A0A2T4YWR9_9HYPH|nr:hypothetical protein [Phreatobacter oligotrophus]PTM49289.1 hypothetical protein C8P69_1193 [Phreatobacter oligotrophus]
MSAVISVRNGSVYLPAEVVQTYFPDIDAVIVLIRDDRLLVMPVHQATAGGCLLKLRNAKGDRVASARDVFLDQDRLDLIAEELPAHWISEQGALCAELPDQMQS